MTLPIQVGPSTITMNRDDRFVVCQPDGRIERLAEEGFFARDTRFVSGYEVFLNGQRPTLLNASPAGCSWRIPSASPVWGWRWPS